MAVELQTLSLYNGIEFAYRKLETDFDNNPDIRNVLYYHASHHSKEVVEKIALMAKVSGIKLSPSDLGLAFFQDQLMILINLGMLFLLLKKELK